MLLILSFLLSFSAWSKFDFDLGFQGRTIPSLGGELFAESGYNQILWGKKQEPKDVLYGLVRPSLGVSTSAVINAAKAELEIFPISFLGFSVGRQYVNSNYDFPFLKCMEITCQGEFVRNWVGSKIALGAKGYVAVASYYLHTLRSPDPHQPMADWRNVIVGEGGEEVQIDRKLLLAKVFNKNLVGFLLETTQFQGSRELKESYAAVYQFRHNDTNYLIGAGSFRSDQQPLALILYFRIHHLMLPSLKLF
jgi:hypothetical protein